MRGPCAQYGGAALSVPGTLTCVNSPVVVSRSDTSGSLPRLLSHRAVLLPNEVSRAPRPSSGGARRRCAASRHRARPGFDRTLDRRRVGQVEDPGPRPDRIRHSRGRTVPPERLATAATPEPRMLRLLIQAAQPPPNPKGGVPGPVYQPKGLVDLENGSAVDNSGIVDNRALRCLCG